MNDLTVVATNPGEMSLAQDKLIAWAGEKIELQKKEHDELAENLEVAIKNKWRASTLKRHTAMAQAKIVFYEKLKAALEAGFCIIPDMDADVFAVRTSKLKAPFQGLEQEHSVSLVKTNSPPVGEGEYVAEMPEATKYNKEVPNSRGEPCDIRAFEVTGFKEIDFPFALARKDVLTSTQQAMMHKIFDEICVLPRRRGADPMVIGRIVGPKPGGYSRGKRINFLITWYIDTKDL